MGHSDLPIDDLIAETNHLHFLRRGGWSYIERINSTGVVCIVARTKEDRIILVEQHRPPVDCQVIELPAGLAGDLVDQANEQLEVAARRELLEETGYEATQLRRVTTVASSAGLTDEVVTIFVADSLEKVAPGGGDESEDITVHEVALDEIDEWLERAQASGKVIDARVFVGLYFLQRNGGTQSRSDESERKPRESLAIGSVANRFLPRCGRRGVRRTAEFQRSEARRRSCVRPDHPSNRQYLELPLIR
jgi:ADP-ribose pyrophosphatase